MQNLLFFLLLTIAGCSKVDVEATGLITGKLTLAPLCGNVQSGGTPGNPCGLSKESLDKIYGEYKVVLKSLSMEVLNEKRLDSSGLFSFSVPEGEYIIDVTAQNPYGNPPVGLAQKVTVGKNQTIELPIAVKTGIR
jgi:hypothetical protein